MSKKDKESQGEKKGQGSVLSNDQLTEHGLLGFPQKQDVSGSGSQADKDAAAAKAGKDFDEQIEQNTKDKR